MERDHDPGPEPVQSVEGEFGIGLLSFWTVGEQLTIRSADAQGQVHQLTLHKGDSGYAISKSRTLLVESGTELVIQPLLPGLKQLSGEKLQWFLGVELRNRLLEGGVQVYIHDLVSRNEYVVEPQKFSGTKMVLPPVDGLHAEIYVDTPAGSNQVALFRKGTRVIESVQTIPELDTLIWGSSYFTGFVDCAELQLTPGTRLGMIQDEKYEAMIQKIQLLEPTLREELSRLKQVEEERASTATHSTLHRAFKSAFGSLPPEEYDWFELDDTLKRKRGSSKFGARSGPEADAADAENRDASEVTDALTDASEEKEATEEIVDASAVMQPAFFDIAGPLYSVRISPASSLVAVGGTRKLRAIARDRKGLPVSENLGYSWEIVPDGSSPLGNLVDPERQEVTLHALQDPGVLKIRLVVRQAETEVEAQSVVTLTDSILSRQDGGKSSTKKGLPSFTYERQPGQAWRSRFDSPRNLIVINSGHRDFLFSSTKPHLKLRYLVRLFSKELVLNNFQGLSASEALDRQIEISLRAEEFLR